MKLSAEDAMVVQVQLTISQVDLDVQNPRIPGAKDPGDALNRIVSSQREKLLRLARDIVDIGLSPGELPYVVAREDDPGLFGALDGNRRLAALKLLDNPALDGQVPFFGGPGGRPLMRRLQELRKGFDRTSVEPIACILFDDREAAEPWLQHRHAGEMDGLGLAAWSADERRRSHDPNDPMVALSDLMRAEGLSEEEDRVLQGQWTTLCRLIEGPSLRALLGLELQLGQLQSRVGPGVLMRQMRAILPLIGAMQAPSRALNTVAQREAFLNGLPQGTLAAASEFGQLVPLSTLRQYHQSTAGGAPANATPGTSVADSPSVGGANRGSDAPSSSGSSGGRAAQVRKTVFKKAEIAVSDAVARQVFDELCSIKQAEHPTAVTVLLRVFIEKSMKLYCSKNSLPLKEPGGRDRALKDLISDVLTHLKSVDPTMTLPRIEKHIKAGDQKAFIGVLHSVIHDPDVFASAADVLNLADTFREFLAVVWSHP